MTGAIEQILGVPEVDHAVDAVGFEAKGHGGDGDEAPAVVLNTAMGVTRAVNATVIALEDAPQGYEAFDSGVAEKFILDPHAEVRFGSTG